MADLQGLMQAAQSAGINPQQIQQVMGSMGGGGGGQPSGAPSPAGGGAVGGPPPGGMPPSVGGGGGGDMAAQLMNIAQMVMSSPQGMQMVQALVGAMGQGGPQQAQVGPGMGGGGQGGMPMGPPPGGMMPPPGPPPGIGEQPMGRGPSTDQSLYDVQEANQGVRGNLPPIPSADSYTGYGDYLLPLDELRQTPMPMSKRTKGMSTEQELEMARKMMGESKDEPKSKDGDKEPYELVPEKGRKSP